MILNDIENFLLKVKMKPATFGRACNGDPNLIFDLRKGRRIWPETEQKIRSFMEQWKSDNQ